MARDGHGNLLLGLLGGVGGAFLAGLAWWGVVSATRLQIAYAAIAVGWVVAQSVLICCQRRRRLPLQVVAGALTLAALAVSEYFIQRSLAIDELGGAAARIPLWSGLDDARVVVEESLRSDPLTGLFWLGAAGVALFVAGTREAVIR